MQTFRIETIVAAGRVLTIRGVPFRAGEQVEVIVLSHPRVGERGTPYPLRNKPFRYTAPFDSVAEKDWNALQ